MSEITTTKTDMLIDMKFKDKLRSRIDELNASQTKAENIMDIDEEMLDDICEVMQTVSMIMGGLFDYDIALISKNLA